MVDELRPVPIPAPAAVQNPHRRVGLRGFRKNPAADLIEGQRSIEPDRLAGRMFMRRQALENHGAFMLYAPLRIIDAAGLRVRALRKDAGAAVPAENYPVPAVLAADRRPIRVGTRLHLAHAHHKIRRTPGRAEQTAAIRVQRSIAIIAQIRGWCRRAQVAQSQSTGAVSIASAILRIQSQPNDRARGPP